MPHNHASAKKPSVFIVSSGRSGTTLLRSILNASNQICIPHESDFIARAYPFFHHKQSFDQSDYDRIVKLFKKTSRENGWGMTEDYLLSYVKEHAPQTFADVNSRLCAAYHQLEGTDELLWGIKAPVLIASIRQILDVFPDTKIVHLIRDGRDVYLSYRRVHEKSQVKFGPKGLISNALYWVDGLRQIHNCPEDQIHELRYEDILCHPEDELSRLCTFLTIQYDPSMHEKYQTLERNQKLVAPKFMESFHAKAKEGLDSRNVQKFRTEMSKFQRFIFELFAAPYLNKYGYALEFPFLCTWILSPFRYFAYFGARQFNNWRYTKRDAQTWERAAAQSDQAKC